MKLKPVAHFRAAMAGALLLPCLCISCKDDYIYDDKRPDNLGSSIYDYLAEDGNFKYFVRLIDDLDYTDVLSRTGSKTLFPADDAAFERFFASNPYGVSSYDELTPVQKRQIMNTAMMNMAYLSETLSNIAGTDAALKGIAMRHNASGSVLDNFTTTLPEKYAENPYWSRFGERNLFMVKQPSMLVHFTEAQMATNGMTGSDFSVLYNGKEHVAGEIYINGISVRERDIICQNGYIHVMSEVLLPDVTMADAIENAPDSKLFSKLMDKFSAPYYNATYTSEMRDYYNGSTPMRPMIEGVDSVFVKGYFNERSHNQDPNGESLASYGMLYYDPSDPYYSSSAAEWDMGTMFVPDDDAMEEYFNSEAGRYLKEPYGSWDNVPTDLLAMFLKNHQKRTFSLALPHSWPTLTDETSFHIDIDPSMVKRCVMTSNGPVYIVKNVFPPIDFKSVYASVLSNDKTAIMKWAITDDWSDIGDTRAMRFYMYLRSMENMYNLIVPDDDALQLYREPISWAIGGASREIWAFNYNKVQNTVIAQVYNCDEEGNPTTLKRTVRDKNIIRNRLTDILNTHIVIGNKVGDVKTGYIDEGTCSYFLTKGGATIAVSGRENDVRITGAGDIETGAPAATLLSGPNRFESNNGRTFFVDRLIHDSNISVYQQLESHPEFKAFFELCLGHDEVFKYFDNLPAKDKVAEIQEIFSDKRASGTRAVGLAVNSFNNYRYTIFVPTAEALEKKFAEDPKLFTWEEIAADNNLESKKEKTIYLLSFIKYHFMDNSAFISGEAYGPVNYETAARNKYDKFHKVSVSSDGHSMTVTGENGNSAHVITSGNAYNIMARDLIVDAVDYTKANNISASSRAVIHLIDSTLGY